MNITSFGDVTHDQLKVDFL